MNKGKRIGGGVREEAGSVLGSDAQALVCPVDCVASTAGVGYVADFRLAWPENWVLFERYCTWGGMRVGRCFITVCRGKGGAGTDTKFIINLPQRRHWRAKMKREYLEAAFADLVEVVHGLGLDSIAIPRLGVDPAAPHLGLPWAGVVRPLLIGYAGEFPPSTRVELYGEPHPAEEAKQALAKSGKVVEGREEAEAAAEREQGLPV